MDIIFERTWRPNSYYYFRLLTLTIMKLVKNENIGYFFFLVIMAVLGCIVFFSKGNVTSSNSS